MKHDRLLIACPAGNLTNVFKARGLATELIGPSTSVISNHPGLTLGGVEEYIAQLTMTSAWADLAGVSAHSYDAVIGSSNVTPGNEKYDVASFTAQNLARFGDMMRRYDNQSSKLKVISEFANENAWASGGKSRYNHNAFDNTCYENAASDIVFHDASINQVDYMANSQALLIAHLNAYIDVAIMWELSDKRSDNKCFGLFDRNNQPSKLLKGFGSLLDYWPKDAVVVNTTDIQQEGMAIAILKGSERLTVLSLVNTDSERQTYDLQLIGLSNATLQHVARLDGLKDSNQSQPYLRMHNQTSKNGASVQLELPGYAGITLVYAPAGVSIKREATCGSLPDAYINGSQTRGSIWIPIFVACGCLIAVMAIFIIDTNEVKCCHDTKNDVDLKPKDRSYAKYDKLTNSVK